MLALGKHTIRVFASQAQTANGKPVVDDINCSKFGLLAEAQTLRG